MQQDDYYAFGMEISRGTVTSPKNEYLYNKKELQEELGQYDYGARFYDPVIGRMTTIDPVNEKFFPLSPYNYVANNPILLNDPTGNDWTITSEVDQQGISHFHILFTGAVLDNTKNHKGRAAELASSIQKQFMSLFNEDDTKGSSGFTVDARATVRGINDESDLAKNETLFTIKDRDDDDFRNPEHPTSHILAQAVNGKNISVNEMDVADMIGGDKHNIKTLTHEIGHTGGLKHPAQDYLLHFGGDGYKYRYFPGPTSYLQNSHNFMVQGDNPSPIGPSIQQMQRIYSLYKSGILNRKDINPVDR